MKLLCLFFFFKQKTAYEIGTGDWSSDVCSSDLKGIGFGVAEAMMAEGASVTIAARDQAVLDGAVQRLGGDAKAVAIDLSVSGSADALLDQAGLPDILINKIGRASCRERV